MKPSPILARRLRRTLAAATVATAAALVVACGGGTAQIEPYVAKRVLVFGDETSVLTAAGPQPEFDPAGTPGPDGVSGRKYSVNAVGTSGAIDCSQEPVWVQALANLYGIVFAECNPNAVADPQGKMFARVGARTTDIPAQVDALVAAGGVAEGDLATVLVGVNDVIELYAQYPTRTEAELKTELRARGVALGTQINRLIELGARVIVATAPDIGLSPFALAENSVDPDRARLLSALISELNAGMRITILNDGRFVALVLADEMVQAMVKLPSSFAIANATAAACTVKLPDCLPTTLAQGASSAGWLWADSRRLAYGGQQRLAVLAEARARGNPF